MTHADLRHTFVLTKVLTGLTNTKRRRDGRRFGLQTKKANYSYRITRRQPQTESNNESKFFSQMLKAMQNQIVITDQEKETSDLMLIPSIHHAHHGTSCKRRRGHTYTKFPLPYAFDLFCCQTGSGMKDLESGTSRSNVNKCS